MVRYVDLCGKLGGAERRPESSANEEATSMSEDDRPKTPEEQKVTGAPSGEDVGPDERLTSEERAMLVSLSAGTLEDGAGGTQTQASGPSAAGETVAPPAEGDLSPEEQQVLEQARDESERVTREELPAMFEKDEESSAAETAAGPSGEQAPESSVQRPEYGTPTEDAEAAAAVEEPVAQGRLAKLLATPLELINRPFKWMPPVWRMGLGLCGVLLLITLLLVILVRALFGS